MQSIGSQASLAEEECASGSVGGVRPCQGRGRGFESRLALFKALDFSRVFIFVLYCVLQQRVQQGADFHFFRKNY